MDKRPRSESPLPNEDAPAPKKSKSQIPKFRNGAEIDPRKPKAADFDDVVQALILRSAFEYEALISTNNSFPETATRIKWAKKVWRNACKSADEHYELTSRISTLVRTLLNLIHIYVNTLTCCSCKAVGLEFVAMLYQRSAPYWHHLLVSNEEMMLEQD